MEGHTNNTAEGLGIQAGLEACIKRGLYNVDHMSDSSLMCNVLNGKSKTTQYRLHEIAKSVRRIKQVCREEGGGGIPHPRHAQQKHLSRRGSEQGHGHMPASTSGLEQRV